MSMSTGRIILDNSKFKITISRLAHQLIENHNDFDDVCIIGIQEKGVLLANRLIQEIHKTNPKLAFKFGKLDITFYRDDFRMRDLPIKATATEIEFLVEGKKVILIDDVVYSGRTIHAAMSALQDFGRPNKVELLCMVDRRFNRELPIDTDYVGLKVDAVDDAYVRVQWAEQEGKDQVLIFSAQKQDK